MEQQTAQSVEIDPSQPKRSPESNEIGNARHSATVIEQQPRINSIDLMRGFALLGLPFMNIINSSLSFGAYLNPTAVDNDSLVNHVVFIFTYLFFDQKMLGLFSLLFGASIVLLAERNEQKGLSSLGVHYRRNLWLLLFGVAHAVFIFPADILSTYGMIALLAYPLRKMPAKGLFAISASLMLLASNLNLSGNNDIQNLSATDASYLAQYYQPSPEQIAREKAVYTKGSYWQVVEENLGFNDELLDDVEVDVVSSILMPSLMLKVFATILLGMALYRLGVLQNSRSLGFYRRLFWWALALGLPLTVGSLLWNYHHGWAMESYFFSGFFPSLFGSVALSLCYLCLIIFWFRSELWTTLKESIQRVGQMALSFYILQSLCYATLFYGYGLGLYGSLNRLELVLICILMAAGQIVIANLYFNHFRQGPLESVLRFLSGQRKRK